jgi:sugar phosphate isomerase/epimerase
MYTRRDLARLAAGAFAASELLSAKPNSVVHGVILGAQSWSFRDRPLEGLIKAMADIGLGYCELWQGHIEPADATRKGLRERRENIAIEEFTVVRDQFAQAGVKVYAYTYAFRDDLSDKEIDRGFEMAAALGARYITSSANVDMAKRVNPFAVKHNIIVGMHNHDSMKPNEFSTPADFAAAMEGNSNIGVNLDIGHFTAANFDPVAYLEKMAPSIVTLHIKDRKKNHGANLPFGQGDTPIAGVLKLLEARKLKIPAMIEYEYPGKDTLAEVRRCYQYCRDALNG